MDITNDIQLIETLNKVGTQVIEDVLDDIIAENKKLIEEIVYAERTSNAIYATKYNNQPTREFEETWTKSVDTDMAKHIDGKFFQEYEKMQVDKDDYIHGSNFSNDVRKYLAEIIYEGKAGKDFFGEGYWTQPRDVWKPLISNINQNLDKWIIEAFRKHGFQARKGHGGRIYW